MSPQSPDLYQLLGVRRNAAAQTIKAAYRRLSKQHHPDIGGDPEAFADIAMAYKVLSDPKARAEYDATGDIPQADRSASEAMTALAYVASEMVSDLIEKGYEDLPGDLVAELRRHIQGEIAEHEEQVAKIDRAAKLYANIERRTSKPADNDKPDIVRGMLAQRRAQDAEKRAQLSHGINVWRHALGLLDGMTCGVESKMPQHVRNWEEFGVRVLRGSTTA